MAVNNKKDNKIKKRRRKIVLMIGVLFLVAASVFLSVISTPRLINSTGLLCIITATVLFTCALFLWAPVLIIFSGVMSFLITFFVSGDIVSAAASLAYIISGSFIYFNAKSKKKRTQIVVKVICALSIYHVLLIVLYMMLSAGGFSANVVSDAVDAWLENAAEAVLHSGYIGEADIPAFVMYGKAFMPALFIAYASVIAYFSTAFFKVFHNIIIPVAYPKRNRIPSKYWRIHISSVSAVIMIIAPFLMLILSHQHFFFPSVVTANIVIILAPGFFIMGIYTLYDKTFRKKPKLLAVILLACIVPAALYVPLAPHTLGIIFISVGVYAALIDDMRKFREKVRKAMFGSDDDFNY